MSEEKTHSQLTAAAEAISLPSRHEARDFPVVALVLLGSCAAIAAFFLSQPEFRLGLLAFAVALIVFAGSASGYKALQARKKSYATQAVVSLVEHDPTPCFLADIEGNVAFRNETADEKFRDRANDTLSCIFADLFADPTSVLFRLQSKAQALGSAREDIVTRKGHIRLAVNAVEADMYLWRVEDLSDRGGGARAADALSLPMLTAGPTGTVLYMNEAFRRLLGGRAKNLSGVFAELPITSGHVHKVLCESGEIESLVAEVPSHGGRREIYLLPGDDLSDAANTGTEWDAIEELPVPLLKISAAGEVLSSNHEARVLLDNKIGSGSRMSDLLKGLGRPLTDWVTETVEGKGLGTAQFLEAVHESKEIHVQVSLNPAGSEDGTDYVVAVLSDVTEFKNLEMQFVQSQKMQAIGQLAGGVAHDFNNLLTAISGHCDLLLLRHDQGDGDFADLVQIHENANRAAALVAQLLAYSRKQNLQPEVMDLRNTLSESTHLLNRLVGERLTLTLDHDPSLSPIRADKRQLEQVLMNLVVNARDAMPEGGNIRVETENTALVEPLHRDRVTVPAGRYVVLRVRDTGIGIPEDVRTKIFDPFWTTKKSGDGTGLGLSTAYGIIKQTGGYIFVDSEVGVGTTFSILIPRHDAPIEHVEKPTGSPNSVAISGDGVVLLVEDEAPVRAFASRALRLRGFTVLEADCAESALTMLSDPDLEVDLFLTDVIMPGKDGPTWVREALTSRPNTKVIFVSGYAEESFGEDQKSIPNSVFLPKPFSLNELTKTVHNQLH
ncbi:two-component system, cell cycle sensor histidine kinase and response regulator CckA [Octadecabacter temperatus]|uniref:histidine kinase n=1 Tax=Octadecabacter temperatus TaxID=1458307 RepID=A0A0K0Y5I8_9RHOB|nr:ATP-binding protein [Octadecabacter temperatus]AKS46151.1 Blue-light-activated protein [Octadecabacter temperatus]SIO08501.1 two-component system, cell cycle sensor histidine kinase and response regulator CckA [Octadecabacter temperatus]